MRHARITRAPSGALSFSIERHEMGRKEDLMNDTVAAYEQSTGDVPDTRDYVAIEDAVNDYIAQEEG